MGIKVMSTMQDILEQEDCSFSLTGACVDIEFALAVKLEINIMYWYT